MIYLVTRNSNLFESENYKIISVEESLKLLKPLTIVGLDTETEGFNPTLKKLLLVQLGNKEFQIVIDCTTIDISYYKDYLESDRLFLGWNLKFDIKFLFHHNIIPKNLYDGFLAEKMIWLGYPAGMHSLSLKSAGEHYCNVELDKSVRGQIIWRKELTDEIIIYSANDVKYLEDIYNKQMEILRSRKQEKAIQLENMALLPTAYFEHCGVRLDVKRWKAKMKRDRELLEEKEKALNDWVVEHSMIDDESTLSRSVDGIQTVEYTVDNDDKVGLELARNKFETERKAMLELGATLVDYSCESTNWGASTTYKAIFKLPENKDLKLSSFLKKFTYVNTQGDLFDGFDTKPRCTINWNSQKQVIPLFEGLGFNLNVFDKETGRMKKSINADIIEAQIDKSDIAPIYLEYSAAQKLVSTYGQNFLDLINPITKRIHSQINQIGTDTHRFSSGGGKDKELIPGKEIPLINLQNLPKDAETRACFIADEGNVWISADYKGEESYILANIAKDEAMLNLLRKGGDMHSLVAKMVYPEELKDIAVEDVAKYRKDLRQKAKAPEFTFAYGGDYNTLVNRDHIPESEAKQIEANYKKGFPGVAKYQEAQKKAVMKLGYINTCPELGFRAHIYDFDKLNEIQKQFNDQFWDRYRMLKASNPNDELVLDVKHYCKRKSASERQSVNYPMK